MKKTLKPGRDYIGVGGGVLVFNDKEEVLLMRRSGTRNEDGLWSKPGGGVEYGEKAIVTMKREVKEEAGIDIKIWGYLPHSDHIIKKDHQHWIAFNYLASVKRGEAKIVEPEKCDKLGWFSLNRLPRKINQTTRESVKNYLAGKYIRL